MIAKHFKILSQASNSFSSGRILFAIGTIYFEFFQNRSIQNFGSTQWVHPHIFLKCFRSKKQAAQNEHSNCTGELRHDFFWVETWFNRGVNINEWLASTNYSIVRGDRERFAIRAVEELQTTRSREIVRKFCGSCAQHKSHHFAIVKEFRETTIYLLVIDRFIQIDFYWFFVFQSFSFYRKTVSQFCAQCAWTNIYCCVHVFGPVIFCTIFMIPLKMIFIWLHMIWLQKSNHSKTEMKLKKMKNINSHRKPEIARPVLVSLW